MASFLSSASSSFSATTNFQRLDLNSLRALIILVDDFMSQLLMHPEQRKSLKLRCASKLNIRKKQEFFEFADHSVISNLYWGIEKIEAALKITKFCESRIICLQKAEEMLQIPALLDEHGKTGAASNRYIVACAYFYLSLVWKLRSEELQMTSHFLQAMLVSPRDIRKEFAPSLWKQIFVYQSPVGENMCDLQGSPNLESLDEYCENAIDETARQQARRYKDWLMYYQVVFYGEGASWQLFTCSEEVHEYRYQETGMGHQGFCQQSDKEAFQEAMANMNDSPATFPVNNSSVHVSKGSDHYLNMSIFERKLFRQHLIPVLKCTNKCPLGSRRCLLQETNGMNKGFSMSGRPDSPISDFNFSDSELSTTDIQYLFDLSDNVTNIFPTSNIIFPPGSKSEKTLASRRMNENISYSDCCTCMEPEKYKFYPFNHNMRSPWKNIDFAEGEKVHGLVNLKSNSDICTEIQERFETAVSALCFSKELGNSENAILEVSTIWGKLENEILERCIMLQEVVLSQLIHLILTSKVEEVIRACISILSSLILKEGSTLNYIKKKNMDMHALANALNKKIYEAAILIYLLHPTTEEVKSLEILPALVEVICNADLYKNGPISISLVPAVAALMMIERLVTAFDDATNNMHITAILSLRILPGLVNLISSTNLEERISLASILVRCMRSDGGCRNFLAQVTPMAPFIRLLQSKEEHARCVILEFLYEILRLPRSSAVGLLRQIRQEGHSNIMHTLVACIQQLQLEHKLFAASLLLELDIMEDAAGKSIFREEAMEVLLKSVSSDQSTKAQTMAASILANLGGSYTVTGEPSTIAWLIKKAGLSSSTHRSMIKGLDISDQSLQELDSESWCRKISRSIILMGNPLFHALGKGLQSKSLRVSRDCLIAVARMGYEFASLGNSLQDSACDTILAGIARFLHPGSELEDRLLACLFLFNYASSQGMQKLVNISEQLRESLRRLSNVTWVAEELAKAIDYSIPLNLEKSISYGHTQFLEFGQKNSGAVHALTYYKGQLHSGHSDGTIKVWDIKGRSVKLVHEVKEHRKTVTCFGLFEPGDSLLSGSMDRTIRIWQMVKHKLECLAVVEMKEPIQRVQAHDRLFYAITRSRGLKVCDASGIIKVVCKNKNLRTLFVEKNKIYLGCRDSSVQEIDLVTDQRRELESPAKGWWMKNRPINSLLVYRDLLYTAGASVKGSNIKVRRRQNGSLVTMATAGKRTVIQTMTVVEDFMYLSCKSSPSIVQVWLREKQQKVGAFSAGSKITSLMVANDIVFCGTPMGMIKVFRCHPEFSVSF
ncbi:putative E3 ubiquitin-protein ligase LIN-1 [Nymphaea thermarum]|nr:putative E3 ubiquitin-protein ligase LIN-1 [Nymphaea thermarum]